MLPNSANPSEITHFVASHQVLDSTDYLCNKQYGKMAFLSTVSAGHCIAILDILRQYLTNMNTVVVPYDMIVF